MSLFNGEKIYGVRWGTFITDNKGDLSLDVKFELKFQFLTNPHMNLIIDEMQKIETYNETVNYYFQHNMKMSHEWCTNSDEVTYFIWRKASREDLEEFIRENNK